MQLLFEALKLAHRDLCLEKVFRGILILCQHVEQDLLQALLDFIRDHRWLLLKRLPVLAEGGGYDKVLQGHPYQTSANSQNKILSFPRIMKAKHTIQAQSFIFETSDLLIERRTS